MEQNQRRKFTLPKLGFGKGNSKYTSKELDKDVKWHENYSLAVGMPEDGQAGPATDIDTVKQIVQETLQPVLAAKEEEISVLLARQEEEERKRKEEDKKKEQAASVEVTQQVETAVATARAEERISLQSAHILEITKLSERFEAQLQNLGEELQILRCERTEQEEHLKATVLSATQTETEQILLLQEELVDSKLELKTLMESQVDLERESTEKLEAAVAEAQQKALLEMQEAVEAARGNEREKAEGMFLQLRMLQEDQEQEAVSSAQADAQQKHQQDVSELQQKLKAAEESTVLQLQKKDEEQRKAVEDARNEERALADEKFLQLRNLQDMAEEEAVVEARRSVETERMKELEDAKAEQTELLNKVERARKISKECALSTAQVQFNQELMEATNEVREQMKEQMKGEIEAAVAAAVATATAQHQLELPTFAEKVREAERGNAQRQTEAEVANALAAYKAEQHAVVVAARQEERVIAHQYTETAVADALSACRKEQQALLLAARQEEREAMKSQIEATRVAARAEHEHELEARVQMAREEERTLERARLEKLEAVRSADQKVLSSEIDAAVKAAKEEERAIARSHQEAALAALKEEHDCELVERMQELREAERATAKVQMDAAVAKMERDHQRNLAGLIQDARDQEREAAQVQVDAAVSVSELQRELATLIQTNRSSERDNMEARINEEVKKVRAEMLVEQEELIQAARKEERRAAEVKAEFAVSAVVDMAKAEQQAELTALLQTSGLTRQRTQSEEDYELAQVRKLVMIARQEEREAAQAQMLDLIQEEYERGEKAAAAVRKAWEEDKRECAETIEAQARQIEEQASQLAAAGRRTSPSGGSGYISVESVPSTRGAMQGELKEMAESLAKARRETESLKQEHERILKEALAKAQQTTSELLETERATSQNNAFEMLVEQQRLEQDNANLQMQLDAANQRIKADEHAVESMASALTDTSLPRSSKARNSGLELNGLSVAVLRSYEERASAAEENLPQLFERERSRTNSALQMVHEQGCTHEVDLALQLARNEERKLAAYVLYQAMEKASMEKLAAIREVEEERDKSIAAAKNKERGALEKALKAVIFQAGQATESESEGEDLENDTFFNKKEEAMAYAKREEKRAMRAAVRTAERWRLMSALVARIEERMGDDGHLVVSEAMESPKTEKLTPSTMLSALELIPRASKPETEKALVTVDMSSPVQSLYNYFAG